MLEAGTQHIPGRGLARGRGRIDQHRFALGFHLAAKAAGDPGVEQHLADPNGYKLTVTGTRDGQPYAWNYTALYDGKPHPVQGRLDVDAITAYRINDKITVGFFTKSGLAGGPYSRFVADDGRSLTVWAGGRNANAAPYFGVLHYQL